MKRNRASHSESRGAQELGVGRVFEGRGAKKDWCGMSAGTVGERKVTARNDVWFAFHYNINEIQACGAGCARSEKT